MASLEWGWKPQYPDKTMRIKNLVEIDTMKDDQHNRGEGQLLDRTDHRPFQIFPS